MKFFITKNNKDGIRSKRKVEEEEACVKNVEIIWIDRNGVLTSDVIWGRIISASCVERWSNTRPSYIWSDTVSRSPDKVTEPLFQQRCSPNKDTEECWSNRVPSYIQSNPLQTKIQKNVDGTHDSYIQYALSTKIEATTLWIEHTMICQQGYRQQHCRSNWDILKQLWQIAIFKSALNGYE